MTTRLAGFRGLLAAVALLVLVAFATPRTVTAQTTSPVPPSDSTGKIISGSIPASGGFGLVVYGGGSYSQLVAASGCAGGRVAFWVTRDGAFVVYVPQTTVAAVNAGFQAAFPNEMIPANTALIGRCLPVADSGIEGMVTIGPVCPVQQDLLPCPDRPYQATLVFLDSQGREAARVTSGSDGRYRTVLTVGRYTVLPLSPPGQSLPRASSVEVTVAVGQFTTVNITYDSGIRSAQ